MPQMSPGVTCARWEAETCTELVPGWRKGAGTRLHWPSPLLHLSTSLAGFLPFLSFSSLSHLPSKFHAHCLCPSQCPSVPSVLARARRCCLTPSPIRKEKRDTKCRLFGRQQYGLTPSFGCCDGKCKCVTGVHNLVWERREGLHLAIAVILVWLQTVLVTLSSLHSCGPTDLRGFLPNSAWENHKTIK